MAWASTELLDRFGEIILVAYVLYAAVFLALGSMFTVHGIIAVTSLLSWRRQVRIGRLLRWSIDVAYGFINPLIYLLLLVASPMLRGHGATPRAWLGLAAWPLFAAIWGLRVCGSPDMLREARQRHALRALLDCSVLMVLAYGTLDAMLPAEPALADVVTRVMVSPLYLVPLLRLLEWRSVLLPSAYQDGAFDGLDFFAAPRFARGARRAALIVMGVAVLATLPRWTGQHARGVVLANRDLIVSIADEYDVDPALVAALTWTAQRDPLLPLRHPFQRMAAAIWALDGQSNFETQGLAVALGPLQISPTVLQTVAVIRDVAVGDGDWRAGSKQMRDVLPDANAYQWGLPAQVASQWPRPVPIKVTKPEVVTTLLDIEGSLRACAVVLAAHQARWAAARRSIRERPDILATVYQLGFARTPPHPDPRSSRFGRRVLAASQQAWLQDAFTRR